MTPRCLPGPGLPVPDGAADTADDVVAELRDGAVAWLALGSDGAPGRTILAAVERAAESEGVPRIWLNAVIERCLPRGLCGGSDRKSPRRGQRLSPRWPRREPGLDYPITGC